MSDALSRNAPEEYLLRGDYLRRRILKDAARTGVMVERADLDQLALLSDDLLDEDVMRSAWS